MPLNSSLTSHAVLKDGCPFAEGAIVRCQGTGIKYKVEGGMLRAFTSNEVYASYGSPAWIYNDESFPECCNLNRCPPGDPMPLRTGEQCRPLVHAMALRVAGVLSTFRCCKIVLNPA